MKFTICDDTIKDLNELEKILVTYGKSNNTTITIEKYSDSNELIKNVSNNPLDYHIFFLDVVMPKNGIETAKGIKEFKEDAIIIFTTTSKEFAVDAFGVRAYDYLIKPLQQEQVFNCVNRLLDELNFSKKAFCKIKSNDLTITTINIKEITFIESINRRLKIYLKSGQVITSTTLHSKFLESIPFEYKNYGFINCHASYVVNMSYVKGITDKFLIMKNEEKIPISKSMLSIVKKTYINFLVGE